MRSYIFFLLILTSLNSFAQTSGEFYIGGNTAFYKFISLNLKYPKEDRQNGIEGKILFKVKIENGSLDSLEIINSISPTINQEAKRVLLMTDGNWRSESNDFLVLPILFVLEYPGRTADNTLLTKRNKLLKKGADLESLVFSDEIRRRNPLDIENLRILIATYNRLSRTEDAQKD